MKRIVSRIVLLQLSEIPVVKWMKAIKSGKLLVDFYLWQVLIEMDEKPQYIYQDGWYKELIKDY